MKLAAVCELSDRQRNLVVPVLFHEVLPPPGFEAIQAARLTDWEGTNPSPVLQQFIAELVRRLGPRPVETEANRETAPQEVPTTGQTGIPGTVFRDTLQDGSQGPDMVIIPAGSFLIGSPAGEGDDDERPQHEVPIARPFAIGKYPVTFEEYDRITKATRGNQRGDEGWGLRSAARGGGTPGLRIDNLGCCLAQDV